MPTIPDGSVDMILCDLPYGTTACKWDVVIPFEPLWKEYKRIIKKNGAIVLFGSEPFSSHLRLSNLKWYKYDWVWNKKLCGNFCLAKIQPMKIHELISVFGCSSTVYFPQMYKGKMRLKGGNKIYDGKINTGVKKLTSSVNDDYYPKSIVEFSGANRVGKLHPTQKPVALLEYLIKTYTLEGETVMDNTMGSGSTGVACKNLNRNFIGIEKDDKYFSIAEKRIHGTMPQTKLAI